MLAKTLLSLLLLLAGPLLGAKETSTDAMPAQGVIRIDGLGRSAATLSGPWRFHLGDNAEWSQPSYNDSDWESIGAEQPWGMQGHAAYSGYAWYRIHLELHPNPGAPRDLALMLPNIDDAYELYWNGTRIGQDGKLPPFPVWYEPSFTHPSLRLSSAGAIPDGVSQVTRGVIALRVWKAPPMSDDSGRSGGFESPPIVGYPEALAAYQEVLNYRWLRSQQFAFAEYLLYALIGIASLVGWLRDRNQWMLFWMTGFSLAPLSRLLLFGLLIAWPAPLADTIGQVASSIRDISLCFLLLWILNLHRHASLLRLTRICAVISLTVNTLDGLTTMFIWGYSGVWRLQVADAFFTGIYFLTALLPLVLVAASVALHKRLDSARWLVAYAAFLSGMIQIVVGVAPQGRRFTHWTLAEKLTVPILSLNGNSITVPNLAGLLLLGAIVYAVYHHSIENRRRQNALEQEFKSARELQQVLIPEELPSVPGYAITSAYRPAHEVGGDFFQIIPLEDRSTLIILGDVSGKGLKAAMAVSLIVGLIRALVDSFDGPGTLLAKLNARLCGRLQGGFTTCVALHLDLHGNCTLASAGHPPPFLNTREIELAGALPLGIFPQLVYEETSLRLEVGDTLALFTDGLLEARSAGGELYGFERLHTLFARQPDAAQASQAAVDFGQDDDITVVILDRVFIGKETTSLHTVESQG